MSKNDKKSLLTLPTIEKKEVVLNEFVKIEKDTLKYANGHISKYFILLTAPTAVVILARNENGDFVLNEEYRHPTKKILLCCPGGFLGEEEDPLDGAERELLEETGFTADAFEYLGNAYPFPGIAHQLTHYVFAKNAKRKCEPNLEPSELLRTIILSRNEIEQRIKSGNDIDGTLLTALGFYDLRHPKK